MSEAGHRCVGACEIDNYARLIYAKQFPGVRLWEDATKLDPKELPDFDILTGGFPCQAFSIAGKRKGFEDTRGSMFFEIARIAKEKRPRYLLLENVKGLLNHDSGNTFRVIISTLDEMGYDAEWQVLNSKYFVPQNRERVFIVGHLRGERTRKIFPLGDIHKQATEPKLYQLNETPHDTGRIYHPEGIARSLRANSGGMGSKTGLYAVDPQLKRIEGKPNVYNTDAQAGKIYDTTGISPTVSGQRVNSQGFIAVENNIKKLGNKNPSGIGQSGNVYDTDGIAPTLCSSDATRGFNSSGYIAVSSPEIKSLGSFPIPFMRRETEPPQKEIAQYLKSFKKITMTELAEQTKIIKTQLEHYFRTDEYGSLPDKNDWLTLKEILSFDNKYDKIMTEYVEDFMTHEMGTRVHDTTGISPTLTGTEKLIAVKSIQRCGDRDKKTVSLKDISHCLNANPMSDYQNKVMVVTKDHGKLRETKDESLAIDANYWKGPDNHGQRTMIYMAHSKGNIKQRIQDRKESWTLSNNSSDFGVIEPVIVADRSRTYADKGRNLESPKKICNSLTSVAKDNYVMEKEKPIKEFGINDDGRKISNAIRQGGRGSVDRHSWDIVNDKMRIRRLTPKECERLQGFPDDWTKLGDKDVEISDTQRYKCLGNAVTVPVVKFVAENLK